MKKHLYTALLFSAIQVATIAQSNFKSITPTPSMGWNSYDAYHGAITESQFTKCVDWLSVNLAPAGYEYAVIDFCWYLKADDEWYTKPWETFEVQQSLNSKGKLSPQIILDKYGRLLPDQKRWPSSDNDKGFKAMGDYVHSKGMKFGIHIMRGIPRKAVEQKLPIKGTSYTAADIAQTNDTCTWLNHMYGVDPLKPGAQEYYNSLFELYASWGVDFIKADDMMVPPYHKGEVEMMRKAIDNCGRPMALSLSCGEAPVSFAKHLTNNANMWRISADFWDNWPDLLRMFELAEMWSPYIGNGTWPDADMIPIGRLCLTGYPGKHKLSLDSNHAEHNTKLTLAEQKALMSLWCIIKSPLMWGGDPLTSSPETLEIIANPRVLEVNKKAINSRQIYERRNTRVWIADIANSEDKYLALFNLDEKPQTVLFDFFWEDLTSDYEITNLWTNQTVGVFSGKFTTQLESHEGCIYKLTHKKK